MAAVPAVLTTDRGSLSLENFMKNERIVIVYETPHGTKAFSMVVKNGVVVESKVGRVKNPTIVIRCNSTEAERIVNSKNPIPEIADAIIDGRIVVVESSSPMFSVMSEVVKLMKLVKNLKLY